MLTTLFLIELIVSDLERSIHWYQERLGLKVEHWDETNGFILFRSHTGTRLALKQGQPQVGSVIVYFQIDNLQAIASEGTHEIRQSEEGYRRILLHDPDGYTIGLFEWTTQPHQ